VSPSVKLPHFDGWHLIGAFPDNEPDDVGSWLLVHNGEALLLEVPEGLRVRDVRDAVGRLGVTLRSDANHQSATVSQKGSRYPSPTIPALDSAPVGLVIHSSLRNPLLRRGRQLCRGYSVAPPPSEEPPPNDPPSNEPPPQPPLSHPPSAWLHSGNDRRRALGLLSTRQGWAILHTVRRSGSLPSMVKRYSPLTQSRTLMPTYISTNNPTHPIPTAICTFARSTV
jgi:hypothetical protein